MPDSTTPEPVLPIPADLYDQIHDLRDVLADADRRLLAFEKDYTLLAANTDSVSVDDLGEPTTAADELDAVIGALTVAGYDLHAATGWVARAHQHASRLRLTESAAARQTGLSS